MSRARSIGTQAPSITPEERGRGQRLKDFLPCFKISPFPSALVHHALLEAFLCFSWSSALRRAAWLTERLERGRRVGAAVPVATLLCFGGVPRALQVAGSASPPATRRHHRLVLGCCGAGSSGLRLLPTRAGARGLARGRGRGESPGAELGGSTRSSRKASGSSCAASAGLRSLRSSLPAPVVSGCCWAMRILCFSFVQRALCRGVFLSGRRSPRTVILLKAGVMSTSTYMCNHSFISHENNDV